MLILEWITVQIWVMLSANASAWVASWFYEVLILELTEEVAITLFSPV